MSPISHGPAGTDAEADLRQLPWLQALDESSWQQLLTSVERCSFAAGEIIILEGDPSTRLYVMHAGWVKGVKMSAAGREQTLNIFGPGQSTNFAAVMANHPAWATLIALEPSELWAIPQPVLAALRQRHPEMGEQVIQALARRLHYAVTLIEDLSLRSVTSRLAHYLLLQLGEDETQKEIDRPGWATQAELAARLGTVPNVVHRSLRELAEAGLIRFDRQRIEILDRDGLLARL